MFFLYFIFIVQVNTLSALSLPQLDRLWLDKNIPKQAKLNKYLDPLLETVSNIKYTRLINITFTLPTLKEDLHETFLPCNPSIIKTSDGYEVICRAVNIQLPLYRPIIEGESPINRNYYLKYDKIFNLISEQELCIPAHLTDDIRVNHQVQDCRLFTWDNKYWFTGFVYLSKLKKKRCKVAMCNVVYGDKNSIIIKSLTLFPGPVPTLWEKNWMPIIEKNTLRFIYSYDPFILLEPNLDTGQCATAFSYTPSLDFSRFRGSAAPILFEDGYLMMVHERLSYLKNVDCYIHRFLFLNKNFIITKISLPFTFTHLGVEFCTSMTIDHSGNNLVMAIGLEDREAKIMLANLEAIKELLHEAPH